MHQIRQPNMSILPNHVGLAENNSLFPLNGIV